MNERVRNRSRNRQPAALRREQILDAATTMIGERGFWATSLREVGDACGITVAGVLHHFPSKEALLLAVLERQERLDAQGLSERLGGDFVRGHAGDVSLAALCRAIVAHNADRPEFVRLSLVLSAEAQAPDHPAHDYFRERQTAALGIFTQLAPPGADPIALARLTMALLDGVQSQWLRDGSQDWVAEWDQVVAGIPGLRVD